MPITIPKNLDISGTPPTTMASSARRDQYGKKCNIASF